MMTFIWACMILSLKVSLGGLFWSATIIGSLLLLGVIGYGFAAAFRKFTRRGKKYDKLDD